MLSAWARRQEVTVVARRSLVGVITAGSLVVAAALGPVAFAQQTDELVGTDEPDAPRARGDASLLTRLDTLEVSLPDEPAPTDVTVDEVGSDGAETSGSFDGDVVGGAATVQTLQAELTSLYVDADDAGTPVGDAISEVARGWLDLGQAYDQLTLFAGNDLAFPIDAEDDEGTATDADELRGRAETGLRLVLGAQQRHLAGYVELRDLAQAEPALQVQLDARAADAERFDRELRPLLHRLLSLRTTQVLLPVDRFETSAPGVDARARSMTVTCVDRAAYLDAAGDPVTDPTLDPSVDPSGAPTDPDDPTAELGGVAAGDDRADCPGLPEDATVSGG
jgi:hypothetical protein